MGRGNSRGVARARVLAQLSSAVCEHRAACGASARGRRLSALCAGVSSELRVLLAGRAEGPCGDQAGAQARCGPAPWGCKRRTNDCGGQELLSGSTGGFPNGKDLGMIATDDVFMASIAAGCPAPAEAERAREGRGGARVCDQVSADPQERIRPGNLPVRAPAHPQLSSRPLVLSGHAASPTPYQSDTPRPSPRTNRTRRVPHPVLGERQVNMPAALPRLLRCFFLSSPMCLPPRRDSVELTGPPRHAPRSNQDEAAFRAAVEQASPRPPSPVLIGHASSHPPY